jgi:hypothetical protein
MPTDDDETSALPACVVGYKRSCNEEEQGRVHAKWKVIFWDSGSNRVP